MREYVFDVKMYAMVPVNASDRKTAERVIESAMESAELIVPLQGSGAPETTVQVPAYVDDIEFPYLSEIDGISVDEFDDDER